MILNNLLFRLGDWLKRNRATVINWLGILALIVVGALLIYYGVERFHAWRFEKKVEALDKRYLQKEAEIKAAEALVNALKTEIAAKDELLEELDLQSRAAKVVHEKTKTEYVYLKNEYEDARDSPLPSTPVSCADLRAELAELGIVR